jgi:hypothetical protein
MITYAAKAVSGKSTVEVNLMEVFLKSKISDQDYSKCRT